MNAIAKPLTALFNDSTMGGELSAIAPVMVPANTTILNEGEYVKVVPLVLSGLIKVIRIDASGKEILLYSILPGESCALSISSCLVSRPSQAVAQTASDTEMILVPADKVRQFMKHNLAWSEFVMRLFHSRFNELITCIDEIAFRQIDFRLLSALKEKQKIEKTAILTITHQQLANELGTAREVVSRLLKNLEKQGKIVNHRGKIEILRLV